MALCSCPRLANAARCAAAFLTTVLATAPAHAALVRDLVEVGETVPHGRYFESQGRTVADRSGDLVAILEPSLTTGRPARLGIFRVRSGRMTLEHGASLPATLPQRVSVDGSRILVLANGTMFLLAPANGAWQLRSTDGTTWLNAVLRGDRIVALRQAAESVELCSMSFAAPAPPACVPAGASWRSFTLAFDGVRALVADYYQFGNATMTPYAIGTGAPVAQPALPPRSVEFSFAAAIDGGDVFAVTRNRIDVLRESGGQWQSAGSLANGEDLVFDVRDGLAVVGRPNELSAFRRGGTSWVAAGIAAMPQRNFVSIHAGGADAGFALAAFSPGLPFDLRGGSLRIGDASPVQTSGETQLGRRIAIGGDVLAASWRGSGLLTYRRRGGTWLHESTLAPVEDPTVQITALAVDARQRVIAGMPFGGQGRVRLFASTNGRWALERELPAPEAGAYSAAGFGAALDAAGTRFAVSASGLSSGTSMTSGRVYVYDASGTTPVVAQTLTSRRPADQQGAFGVGVRMDGDLLAIGDFSPDVSVPSRIELYRFEPSSARYVHALTVTTPTGQYPRVDQFDLAGNRVAIPVATGDTTMMLVYRIAADSALLEASLPGGYIESSVFAGPDRLVQLERVPGQQEVPLRMTVYARESGWGLNETRSDLTPLDANLSTATLAADADRIVAATAASLDDSVVGRIATWTREPTRSMPPSAGGIWYDPQRSGEGWFIERLPGGRALLLWYTYPSQGSGDEQSWILATGSEFGNLLVFDDALTSRGPRFGDAFDAGEVAHRTFGTLTVAFEDCSHAWLGYTGQDGSTALHPIVQIGALGALSCAGTQPPGTGDLDGAWFDPARSGEGLLVQEPAPGRVIASWFTYDDSGRAMWLFADGTRVGNRAVLDALRPVGARFGDAFDPAAVRREPWGTLTIERLDCARTSLSFRNSSMATREGTLALQRLTQPLGAHCP